MLEQDLQEGYPVYLGQVRKTAKKIEKNELKFSFYSWASTSNDERSWTRTHLETWGLPFTIFGLEKASPNDVGALG